MPNKTYMPGTTQGIGDMLTAFAANIPGALATKYNVTAADEPAGEHHRAGLRRANIVRPESEVLC